MTIGMAVMVLALTGAGILQVWLQRMPTTNAMGFMATQDQLVIFYWVRIAGGVTFLIGQFLFFASFFMGGEHITEEGAASASNGGEPWWPTGKGGQWVNDFNGTTVTKPGRTPVNQANCDFKGGVPLGTYTGAVAIKGVSVQPEYLIEYFKRSVPGQQEKDLYRITARGFGYTQRTQVVVQSIYLP